jgi:hypothetical protein
LAVVVDCSMNVEGTEVVDSVVELERMVVVEVK